MYLPIGDQIALVADGHRLREPDDARLTRAVAAFTDESTAGALVSTLGRAGLRHLSAAELAEAGDVSTEAASGLWPAGQRQSRGTEIMGNFRPCLSLANSNTLWFSFSPRGAAG